MQYAIFFRNMNLGHRNSPTREQLLAAFHTAGASKVRSFQTNGTVLIEANDPAEILTKAKPLITNTSNYDDAAFIQPLHILQSLLEPDPFASKIDERTYRTTVTFFTPPNAISWKLPWTNPKDDVDIIHIDFGIALGITRKAKSTAGSPTLEIEKETGGSATTRTSNTIKRLIAAAQK